MQNIENLKFHVIFYIFLEIDHEFSFFFIYFERNFSKIYHILSLKNDETPQNLLYFKPKKKKKKKKTLNN
jgi:hypothetical protein